MHELSMTLTMHAKKAELESSLLKPSLIKCHQI